MVLTALGLAACNTLDRSPQPVSALAGLSHPPGLSVGPATSQPIALGNARAVAMMPQASNGGGALHPIVLRRAADDSPKPGPSSTEDPKGDSRDGNRDVTLNFAGADIRDVIAAILGQTLKLNYVIDPAVKGPVTFNVSRPLSRDELLPTLEAVLNSRGATMVRSDGIIRVMPMQKAGKSAIAAPISQGGDAAAIGEHTEVFPLRFVAPGDMQHLLEKVLPPGQVIVADQPHHLLLVQGSPTELQVAADTVRIFDVDQLSGMSMALVPLRNANPDSLAAELTNIFQSDKDRPNNAIRFMAIKRLNAVMILTRSDRYLDEARAWIGRLDRAQDVNERRVYVYYLQYSKAVEVGEKLQSLLSGLNVQFKSPAASAAEGGGVGAADKSVAPAHSLGPQKAAPPAEAKPPRPLMTADAAADPPASGPNDGPGVRIEADEAHNALLISATARDYNLVRQVLEGIDTPPLQVLIKVTVAEVTLNNQLRYGVEAFLHSGNGFGLLTTGVNPLAITPTLPGFAAGLTNSSLEPRAILQALSQLTQTRVISTPRLLVLSNQTARLQVGDVVPIVTQTATSTVTSNPLIVNNVQYKDTGVVLSVTPRVNAGGYVTLDINQSVSDVVNTTTSNIDSPTFRQRQLTSTVSVKSGQSILLGGLIQNQDNRDSSGIPILHEIPVLGTLFGNHDNSTTQTELIMFLTPVVIRNNQEAEDVTRHMQRQFEAVLDNATLSRPHAPTL